MSLIVSYIFSARNVLIVGFFLFYGLIVLMLSGICGQQSKYLVPCQLQHPPDCPPPQYYPANQLLWWLRRYCNVYCCLGWFLWQHWHHCKQENETAMQIITLAWLKIFVLGKGASLAPWTCCIPSQILLWILNSHGGSGNDGREGILLELTVMLLDPLDFFVVTSHATKWGKMSRTRH